MLTEKMAWDFLMQPKLDHQFKLTVLLTGTILGPNLTKQQFASGDLVKGILLGELESLNHVQILCVDVRDVAKAHLSAALKAEANGQRIVLSAQSLWYLDISQIMYRKFGKFYPDCTRTIASKCSLWLSSFFDEEDSRTYKLWGMLTECDSEPSKELLELRYADINITMIDMVKAMI